MVPPHTTPSIIARPAYRIGFVLVPGFALFDLACALESLREANRALGWTAYQWVTFADKTTRVRAGNGVEVPVDATIDSGTRVDRLFVCADGELGDFEFSRSVSAGLCRWLQRLDRAGVRLGAIGAGTYVLARANLIRGRRFTIHWESAPALVEQFPGLSPTRSVFEIDQGLCTCSGGTAVTDLFVRIVTSDHGRQLTEGLTMQFQLDRVRSTSDEQRSTPLTEIDACPRKLQTAIREMESALELPVSPETIANRAGVTTRHLQRLFRAHAGVSPARFYMDLRLRHAKLLLNKTRMPMLDVAVAAGFTSHSHFSKRYRDRYGRTPQQERALRRNPTPTGPPLTPLVAIA